MMALPAPSAAAAGAAARKERRAKAMKAMSPQGGRAAGDRRLPQKASERRAGMMYRVYGVTSLAFNTSLAARRIRTRGNRPRNLPPQKVAGWLVLLLRAARVDYK